jgi:acyl carrier protein
MTRDEFLQNLEFELGVPQGSLKVNEALRDLSGWDSMAGVIFIGLADEKLGAAVSADEIARSRTVNDLLSLLGNRLTTC